ncbi:(2Fe-2S)-binding protein, partial [Saccharomonospora iraqiensis]|uniref:(2Fe-2S)-binding protein n=1 Tax=Saccharomonospora iraqiensis TaxID=52698 RepID=UPI0012FBE0F7
MASTPPPAAGDHPDGTAPRPVPPTLPATVLADPTWLAEDLVRAERLYGRAGDRVLGTIRWYSASSVLVAPALEPWAHTGVARDPALDAVTLDMHPNGRFLDARSDATLGSDTADLGAALARALDPVVAALAGVSGAPARALWAVAVDSVANRLLWAGSAVGTPDQARERAGDLVREVSAALGRSSASSVTTVPRPRFETVGGRVVVRRSSCCLIYRAPGVAGGGTDAAKCVSCPRQTPA